LVLVEFQLLQRLRSTIPATSKLDRVAREGEDLWRYLTRRHKRRRPRRARPSRDTIKDRAFIRDRPKDIEARADIGHWEGDPHHLQVDAARARPP